MIRYLIEYKPAILNGRVEFRAADGSFCTCALHAERFNTRGEAQAVIDGMRARGADSSTSLYTAEHHWDE